MLVTRVRNFFVGGTAFALSPEHINHKEMGKETPSGYAKLGAPKQQTRQRVFILLFYFLFIHAFSIPLTYYVCLYVHRSGDVDCGNTYQGLKANGKTRFLLDAAPRARRVSHSFSVWC